MSTSPSRQQVLHLYRHILKQANQFTNLNFRNHAQRRIAYAFRQKKNLTDPTLVNDEFQQGLQAFNLRPLPLPIVSIDKGHYDSDYDDEVCWMESKSVKVERNSRRVIEDCLSNAISLNDAAVD
eukprot:scaffold8452_cov185-Ochromonas_danica.AAC.18